jgi:ribose-phosphate pyrophosphokinase
MKTLFSHPNFDDLASEITGQYPEIKKWNMQFTHFADEWPNISFQNVENEIEEREVYYLADMSKPGLVFENVAIFQALTRYFAQKVHVILPFYPVGTMERVSVEWEVATAKTFARILSSTPRAQDAITTFHTFDIHDVRERFYTSDEISFRLHSMMDELKKRISLDTIIVFPDEGAKKRFANAFWGYEVVHASKVRLWEKREITIENISLEWKKVCIVDDLIQSGGTLIQTALKLKEMWAAHISAFATHGVFVKDALENLTQHFDSVITTDTIPKNNQYLEEYGNLEILSIKQTIVDKILKISHEK